MTRGDRFVPSYLGTDCMTRGDRFVTSYLGVTV